jgi:hypothetical protein
MGLERLILDVAMITACSAGSLCQYKEVWNGSLPLVRSLGKI